MSKEYSIDLQGSAITGETTVLELRIGPFLIRPIPTPPGGQPGPWLWMCKEDGEGMGVPAEKLLGAIGHFAAHCVVKDLKHFWDEEF